MDSSVHDILAQLNITSLDDSDIEQGLHDLNSDVASGASFAAGSLDEESSVASSTSLQVRAALDAAASGVEAALDGGGIAALEARLRLQPHRSAGAGALAGASAIAGLSAVDARLQELARVVAPLQEAAARVAKDCRARPGPSEVPMVGGLPTARALRLHVSDLHISKGYYQSLKGKGDDELNAREWMQIQFHEAQSVHRAELERLRQNAESLGDNHFAADSRAQRAERQLAARQSEVSDLKQELEQLQQESRAQLERVTADLRASQRSVGEHEDKARRFDETAKENRLLAEQAKALQESLSAQSATLQQLQKDHTETLDQLHHDAATLRLTKRDAEDNDRRARLLEDEASRYKQETEELKAKVESLREKKKELARKATTEQERTTHEVKERVDAEIQRLQEQARSDLEAVRVNLNCLHDKEVLMLQDRISVGEQRVGELQRRLEEEEHAHQKLQLSAARVKAELQAEVTELSGALKLRAFETERAVMTHEEVSSMRSRLEVENEQLRQQVDVLRKEYYTLEVEHRGANATDRAELASLREQLRGYMEVEKELDAAIRAAAEGVPGAARLGGGGAGEAAAHAHGVDEALLIGTTLASAPTSVQRRIQQSLLLAQEVQRQKRQVVQLQLKLEEARAEVQHLREEGEASRMVSRASTEPQAYILDALTKREAEAIALRRELKSCNQDLEQCRRHLQSSVEKKVQAEEDLKKLLGQREHLSILRTALTSDHGGGTEVPRAGNRGRAASQPGQAARPPPAAAAEAGPSWFLRLRTQLAKEGDGV